MNNICATTGKRQYTSDKEAQKGLEKFKERMLDYEGEPYFCMYCGDYHFGARKKPVSKKKKKT